MSEKLNPSYAMRQRARRRSPHAALLNVSFALCALLCSTTSHTQQATLPPWETWPSGRLFASNEHAFGRPYDSPSTLRVCSFSLPVCVHASAATGFSTALRVLQEAEKSMSSLLSQARLPVPLSDGREGGSGAFDIYLTPLLGPLYRIGFDLPLSAPYDRAAAFALLEASLPEGCTRETAIARIVASAMLTALDAGEAGGVFASSASYLAMAITQCFAPVISAIDEAQTHPERAILHAGAPDDPNASPLFLWYLDGAFGSGSTGSLLTALWYAGTQSTPAEATRFHNSRDLLTTVNALAKSKQKTLADVLIDFAITRAFLGNRDDGLHLPEAAVLGTFGRPRFDASYPFNTLPRRLSITPLEPTGTVYVWIDLAGAPEHARLGFQADWEEPITMRWALVRVGKDGKEVSRVDVLREPHVQHVERTVLELDGLAGVLITGINVGEISPEHSFRIDEAPYEPHGAMLLFVAEARLSKLLFATALTSWPPLPRGPRRPLVIRKTDTRAESTPISRRYAVLCVEPIPAIAHPPLS